jgi:hypothetical protein
LTVVIRTAGGSQWGAEWVRYVVGSLRDDDAPLDVVITLPRSAEMISRHEVFDADEAAELFYGSYKTGDIPAGYALRPVEGFTAMAALSICATRPATLIEKSPQPEEPHPRSQPLLIFALAGWAFAASVRKLQYERARSGDQPK